MSAKMEADGHHQKLRTHPELRADGGLTSSSAHLQGLVSASATNMLKQVIDEIKPARGCGTEQVSVTVHVPVRVFSTELGILHLHLLSLRINRMSSLKVSRFFSRIPQTSYST